MDTSGRSDEWTFADGTKLRSFRVGNLTLQVYYDDSGVITFGVDYRIEPPGSKIHLTTWRRGEGFTGAIATLTSHPDIGSIRPAPPMDLVELADIIETHGSGIPEPMRLMILQTLRGSAR